MPIEIGAQVLLMGKKGVDGVYDADPAKHPDAVRYDQLSYDEFLARGLKVADATAISLCRDNRLPIVVFNMTDERNIDKIVSGHRVGTLVRT